VKTEAAYKAEQQRAREAEERFLLARDSVAEIVRVCEEELADRPDMDNLRRQLLEDALAYYQKLIEQRHDDPSAQEELANTRNRVQKILDDLAVLQGAGQLHLLDRPDVLDDLRLSEEQQTQIIEQSRRRRKQWESFSDLGQLSREQLRQRFLDLARDGEAASKRILTSGQLRRLRQIELQLQGPRAFQDPEVTADLKLTTAQKERIRAIQAEAFPCGPREPHGGRGPREGQGPREQAADAVEKIKKELLTEEQVRQWQKLTGEPFKETRPPRPPPGPPPGRPFGRGP
jgi:eukaryotic-like serine/threonine-protein kinase